MKKKFEWNTTSCSVKKMYAYVTAIFTPSYYIFLSLMAVKVWHADNYYKIIVILTTRVIRS